MIILSNGVVPQCRATLLGDEPVFVCLLAFTCNQSETHACYRVNFFYLALFDRYLHPDSHMIYPSNYSVIYSGCWSRKWWRSFIIRIGINFLFMPDSKPQRVDKSYADNGFYQRRIVRLHPDSHMLYPSKYSVIYSRCRCTYGCRKR